MQKARNRWDGKERRGGDVVEDVDVECWPSGQTSPTSQPHLLTRRETIHPAILGHRIVNSKSNGKWCEIRSILKLKIKLVMN